MLNPDCYMRSYLTLCILVLIPRSSLDHMPMTLWDVKVPNPRTRLWNKWVNCLLTNPCRDKIWLHLNPPKWRVYFPCNCQTRRVTSSLEGMGKRVKTIGRVGTRMKMPILMSRTNVILGETSILNVRLSFLASCVRTITSLLVPSYRWSLEILGTGPNCADKPFTSQSKYELKDPWSV